MPCFFPLGFVDSVDSLLLYLARHPLDADLDPCLLLYLMYRLMKDYQLAVVG